MPFEKFTGRQLGHPSGILSGLVARMMNRTNAEINQNTVQLLEIKPTDCVLEIGFGGGNALLEMSKIIQSGLLAGIEVSDAMLKRSRNRFKSLIFQGKMELREGNSTKIPYQNDFFDRVCAINCIYFWPNPVSDLKEIRRVMKNEGKLVISVYTKEKFQKYPFTRHGFILYSDSQIQNLLNEAGFKDIRLEQREGRPIAATYAIATKR